ncbi:MAG: HlyC/CorC family transporter [Ruminococcaceae bacterium]|nr:HlyC/CorC family transporter [Oscillospiraceae bacterium]
MDTDGNIRSFLSAPSSATGIDLSQNWQGILWLTLLFVIFVIAGGFFGAAESGFSAMNKIRIKAKAEDGNRRAKRALYVDEHFEKALTTLLISGNIAHIAAAALATVIATRLFGESETVTVLTTVITTVIVFLFSEMIPKSFANDRSETTALSLGWLVIFLMRFFYPLVWFFTLISKGFSKFISLFVKVDKEPSITEDELYDIIDTIEEEGVVNEEQSDLLKSALDFSETYAKDVMTMRADICALDSALSNTEILKIIKKTTHSRLPVYEGDLDHMIGTLQIRTFIREYRKNNTVDLRNLLIPPFHVDPNAKIDDLLSVMRQHKCYLAIVSDEEGHTQGLITIEDFLEELVGEIWDEDDVVDKNFVKLGGNRFRVNPRMTMGEVCHRIGIKPPDKRRAARPLLSIILEYFGRIPEEEEIFTLGELEITIEEVEENKITAVDVHLLSPETTPDAPDNLHAEDEEGGAAE